MISVGGFSYSNGIKFISQKYNAKFIYSQGDTKLFLRKNPNDNVFAILENIPFLRGIISSMKSIKVILFLLIWDVLRQGVIFVAIDPSTVTYNLDGFTKILLISQIVLVIIEIVMLIFILVKRFKSLRSTWSYHGAEHKVIYTNDQNIELTLENCRKSPKVNDDCGTMFCVPLVIIFTLVMAITSLCGINMLASVSIILSISLAYEVFLFDRNTPVFRFFFKIGYWLQDRLFTREPNDTQLNLAIDTFKLLEMAETDQIPKEELENLLKSKNALNMDLVKRIINKETVTVS